MRKTKILSLLLPLLTFTLVGCGEDSEQPEWEFDKTSHFHLVVGEDGKETKADKANHDYGEEVVVTPATCTAKGKSTQTCKVCGFVKENDIKMIDHVLEDVPSEAVTADCSHPGKTVKKCKYCDFRDETVIPATAHTLSGQGTPKTIEGRDAIEYECSVCHQKSANMIAFMSMIDSSTTAEESGGIKLSTGGEYISWNFCLPAGDYDVYFEAKYSSSGAGYSLTGSSSRGVDVQVNGTSITFDGTKTEVDLGLSTSEFKSFTFCTITATGGTDTLSLKNPYYRFVFDKVGYITFKPVK